MPPLIDLTGKIFGRLVVIRRNDGESGPDDFLARHAGARKKQEEDAA